MPVQKTRDDDGNEFFGYSPPDSRVLHSGVRAIYMTAVQCALINGALPNKGDRLVFDDYASLSRIVIRVDQRIEYFKIYHSNTNMWELRQAALKAYWVLKYRPFRIQKAVLSYTREQARINEKVALHILWSAIVALRIAEDSSYKVASFSRVYIDRILHAFSEHDICKEEMMMIAESLYERV
jgi:hypothetical protein